ncbi:MAG: glycosyltransferase [Rhabdochlamydiaceae bacterium]|nr:glycosyltransferase [Candidatus Amphrikana amoebophyrae]
MKSFFLLLVLFCSISGFSGEFNPLVTTPSKTKFAIMIASYNNEKWLEWNLNSALSQNYDPDYFHIYYLNDCSTDNTLQLAKEYVSQRGMDHMVTFVNNEVNLKPIGNYHNGVKVCNIPDDHVIVILDGDDALYGTNVLNYLNHIYRNSARKILLTYGQFREKNSGRIGFCAPYPAEIEKFARYREYHHIPSHLRTYYCWLFKKIKIEDLTYNGVYLPMAGDMGSMIPMVEMAKGHFHCVEHKVLYYYNDNNPLSEHFVNKELQQSVDRYVRSRESYDPLDIKEKRKLDRLKKLRSWVK